MPAKNKPLIVYLDDIAVTQLDVIRDYYQSKNNGMPVKITDGYVGREMIREKYTDIVNENTRSLTIKKMHADIVALRSEVADSASQRKIIEMLEIVIDQLGGNADV